MMSDLDGNTSQTRAVAEQVGKVAAKLAVEEFIEAHPEFKKPELPAPIKTAAAIISALLVMAVGGTLVWAMTTLNETQVTVARIDERMRADTASQADRFEEINRRLTRLEQLAGEER